MDILNRGAEPRLTPSELARTAAVDEDFIESLIEHSILSPDVHGHQPADVYRTRFAALAVEAGITLPGLRASMDAGTARMGDLGILFPEPVHVSQRTHAQLAADLEVEVEMLQRVRLASGLATRQPGDPVPPDEEHILRLIVSLSRGFGDPETSIRIARNYGERVQRIVVSGVRTYEDFVYGPLNQAMPDIDAETRRVTSEQGRKMIDSAESLITAFHRRYMEAALMSMWLRNTEAQMARHGEVAIDPDRSPGIAFVDLSGFTQMTEEQGDDASAWLANQLVSEVEIATAAHGTRIVKLLGDGVMLHGDDPGRLIETAIDLVEALPRAGLPPAHAGIHAGPLIERDGDYFGRAVNIAARIADHATAHEVLLSETAARQAPAHVMVTELPAVALRGVTEPLALYRAVATAPQPLSDPASSPRTK